MINVNFYLDQPYQRGNSPEEQGKITQKIKECKKQRKAVPKSLFNERQTSVYLIVTLKKKLIKADRAKLIKVNTGFRTLAKTWNFNECLPDKSGDLKNSLEDIKSKVIRAYYNLTQECIYKGEELSINRIENLVHDMVKSDFNLFNSNNLYKVFEDFLKYNDAIKTERTRQKYKTLIDNLKEFERVKNYPLTFESINKEFLSTYLNYLRTEVKNQKTKEKGLLNNTIDKYLMDFKTFLKWSYENDYHKNQFFKKFESQRDEVDPISLEFEEFKEIVNHIPSTPSLQETKDVFVFEILAGGQRYGDIENMRWEDLDLEKAIWTVFQKKGRQTKKIEIPLHGLAISILGKYKGCPKPLPVISNQKYNDNIKDLCKEVGIDSTVTRVRYSGAEAIKEVGPKYEFLSSHICRKTLINIGPELGIPMEVTMSLTGHKSHDVVLEHYRKVSIKEKQAAINKIVIDNPVMKVL